MNTSKNITKAELNVLIVEHENDIYFGSDEIWIGLKGTTTLKVVLFTDEEPAPYQVIEYNVTAQELRKDPDFFVALFQDGDVNHDLSADNQLTAQALRDIFNWYNGNTNILPVTACGLVNFTDCRNY